MTNSDTSPKHSLRGLLKKAWATVGFTGLIVIALYGNLIYMNLRPNDPLLAGWEEYSTPRFETLMERGEPILVEVYASWCPTCLAQHKAFQDLIETGHQPEVRALRVDFERDLDFRKANSLDYTGVLILYRNGTEIARAAGLTDPDSITRFLRAHDIEFVKATAA